MALDATFVYPSAMYVERSKHPKIETGYAFTIDMNDKLVDKSNKQMFDTSAF